MFHMSSYVSGMHEFGIIGLHAKPDDVVNELNELDRVYEVVSGLFNTPVSTHLNFRSRLL